MIKDKAKELASAIMDSREYTEYARAKKKLEENRVNQEMLEAFAISSGKCSWRP